MCYFFNVASDGGTVCDVTRRWPNVVLFCLTIPRWNRVLSARGQYENCFYVCFFSVALYPLICSLDANTSAFHTVNRVFKATAFIFLSLYTVAQHKNINLSITWVPFTVVDWGLPNMDYQYSPSCGLMNKSQWLNAVQQTVYSSI